ncbi:MAG: LysR family transcriptional regulator [Candidimonas sp.]|nr:MAG: LysR family transcriptional regulator [Candidimonas sp.]TAM24707.1 MAG: LysR family transcriptional regulator [Candidimonas sp.]TAM75722.1 MAG: LysR family transcriptional regulator [Candidimonas sp.]
MNLKQLDHLLVLSETLSFSKAAQRVHLSQSALSKSIAALEEEFNIQIFDRTPGNVSITSTGQFVIDHAKNLLSEAKSFNKNIDYLKTGSSGSVALGTGPFPAASFLDAGIREFHKRYPQVSLHIRIDHWKNLLMDLKEGRLDFFMADTRDIADDAMLTISPIGGLTVAFFCDRQHPLVAGDPGRLVKPQELLSYTLASVSLPTVVFHELKRSIGLEHNDIFAVRIECDDIALIKKILPGSDIIFSSSNLMMESELQAGQVVRLNIPMTQNRFGDWGLVRIKHRTLTPSANLFATLLIELIREGSKIDSEKYGFKKQTFRDRHSRKSEDE